jgi:anti-sigma regulatory factor (Ser/Thr protein kinase)
LLVHDSDEELVAGTRDFVTLGLGGDARVLVHGTADRVRLLRKVLGTHPRLDYGYDEQLYRMPMTTLFAYQKALAEAGESTEFWVTGTVPLGRDVAERAGWARYESAVNEALGGFPFRALCTYDTRDRPASVIAAARATHPSVTTELGAGPSREYVDPPAFLAHPLAQVPEPPRATPALTITVTGLHQLSRVRHLVNATARAYSAVPQHSIQDLVLAVNEATVNGLVHGSPPVRLALWPEVGVLVCQVLDCGPGGVDPSAGLGYPHERGPMGLWAMRQLVDDAFISNVPGAGCRVLLIKS